MVWLGWAGSSVGELPDGWRQGDAGGAQGEACSGAWRRAQQKAFAVLFDLRFGQRVESGEDVRPGTRMAERGDAVLQLLLQHQGEKATRHMAANGLVELMEIGRVANRLFEVRNARSTIHKCL